MVKIYGNEHQKVVAAKLPASGLASAGSLIRSFAEIEDILNLWITQLAQTTEGISTILMGKMGISAKVQMLEYLAQLHGEEETAKFKRLISDGFSECLACRNALAHSVLLGKGEKDHKYAFLTSKALGPKDGKLTREVISYGLDDLKDFAQIARNSIPLLEKALGLTSARKRHLHQSLMPHRKSSANRNNKAPK